MLAISFFELHVAGGIYFQLPLTILFVINLAVITKNIFSLKNQHELTQPWLDAVKQIGALILGLGAFGSMTGFIQMFDALEGMKETLPLNVIAGGVKVALLNIFYALILFSISLFSYIILSLINNKHKAA